MRHGIEEVLSRVVDDSIKRPAALDAEHFVDLAQRQVVASTGLIAPGIDEPRTNAHALDQSCRLPGRRRHRCRLAVAGEAHGTSGAPSVAVQNTRQGTPGRCTRRRGSANDYEAAATAAGD